MAWAALDRAVLARWGLEKVRRPSLTWLAPAGDDPPEIARSEDASVELVFTDASAAEAMRLLGMGGAACGGQRFSIDGEYPRAWAAAIALHIGGVVPTPAPIECPNGGPPALLGTMTMTEPARAIYRDASGVVRLVEGDGRPGPTKPRSSAWHLRQNLCHTSARQLFRAVHPWYSALEEGA